MKSRIWLCGITQDKVDEIDELTKDIYQYFDGLIFVDGGSVDGTKQILEHRKKEGAVIYRKFTNDHDFQSNEILRQGPMNVGDWFILRDSEERLSENFCKQIKNFVSDLNASNINSCFWLGKGFMFKYFDDMFFQGNPHWGLVNCRDNKIDLAKHLNQTDNDKNVTWNTRLNARSRKDWFKHHLKYYWSYGRSNHLLLGREDKIDEFRKLEENRQNFRYYCYFKYGLNFSIESLHDFLQSEKWNEDKDFKKMFEMEPILQRYYLTFIKNIDISKVVEKLGEG